MPEFDIPIPLAAGGKLPEVLAELPGPAKAYLKQGFAALAKFPENRYEELVAIVAEFVTSAHVFTLSPDRLAARLGVPPSDAAALLGSVSLIAWVLSVREETAQEFVETATAVGILDEGNATPALAFSHLIVKDRPALKGAIERSRLGTELLPSLTGVGTAVDVRLRFEEGRVAFAVPVALVHLRTDVRGQALWFQLTRSQLEQMIQELQETLRRLQGAEQWVGGASSAKE
jgi:hypothetical protein